MRMTKALLSVGLVLLGCAGPGHAQTPVPPTLPQAAAPSGPQPTLERLTGVWVEGPGYDVSYGGTYDACAKKCLSGATCVMIEYYRPEKKCNLYNTLRPRKAGGSSDVGIRR